MYFEIFVILATILVFFVLKKNDKDIYKRFLITFIAVLLFEYLTSAMWMNKNLEFWAYLYKGVSWVITLGWVSIIVGGIAIINHSFPKLNERKKFFLQLILISVAGFFAELLVRLMDIREYSPLAEKSMSGINLGLVPIEALYYIPVFMTLVISFKRYWEISMFEENKKVKNKLNIKKKRK
jgi:hypothetical protein